MVANQANSENNQPDQYQAVLASFEQLSSAEDPIRLEFQLIQAARSHKLPISSYRKMFGAWLTSQEEKGVQL